MALQKITNSTDRKTSLPILEHSPMDLRSIRLCRYTGRRPVYLTNIGKRIKQGYMSEANITAAIVHVRGQQLVAGRTKLLIPTVCTVKWRSSPRSNRATGLF